MKFWLKYVKKLTTKHWQSSIVFVIFLVSTFIAFNSDREIKKYPVVNKGSFKVGDLTTHFVFVKKNDRIEPYTKDSDIKLENGYYVTDQVTDLYIISMFISVVMGAILFVLCSAGGSSEGITFKETYYEMFIEQIEVVLHDDTNYYRLDGRLLFKMDQNNYIQTENIHHVVKSYLENKHLYPIWKTPKEERLEKLKTAVA